MTTLAIVLGLSYVVATTVQAVYAIRALGRKDEEALVERRELTDRIMALSERPQSLDSLRREASEEGEVIFTSEEVPWWREDNE